MGKGYLFFSQNSLPRCFLSKLQIFQSQKNKSLAFSSFSFSLLSLQCFFARSYPIASDIRGKFRSWILAVKSLSGSEVKTAKRELYFSEQMGTGSWIWMGRTEQCSGTSAISISIQMKPSLPPWKRSLTFLVLWMNSLRLVTALLTCALSILMKLMASSLRLSCSLVRLSWQRSWGRYFQRGFVFCGSATASGASSSFCSFLVFFPIVVESDIIIPEEQYCSHTCAKQRGIFSIATRRNVDRPRRAARLGGFDGNLVIWRRLKKGVVLWAVWDFGSLEKWASFFFLFKISDYLDL